MDELILSRQKYSMNDEVICNQCGERNLIRHLTIVPGGEARCPNCTHHLFKFSDLNEPQRIRQQCITDYKPKKDPWNGTAEFRVVLKDRRVSMFVHNQKDPVAVTAVNTTYDALYDVVSHMIENGDV